jgi:hypothetical protein
LEEITETLIALEGFRTDYETLPCTADDGDTGENVFSLTLVFRTKLGMQQNTQQFTHLLTLSLQYITVIIIIIIITFYFILVALQPFVGLAAFSVS